MLGRRPPALAGRGLEGAARSSRGSLREDSCARPVARYKKTTVGRRRGWHLRDGAGAIRRVSAHSPTEEQENHESVPIDRRAERYRSPGTRAAGTARPAVQHLRTVATLGPAPRPAYRPELPAAWQRRRRTVADQLCRAVRPRHPDRQRLAPAGPGKPPGGVLPAAQPAADPLRDLGRRGCRDRQCDQPAAGAGAHRRADPRLQHPGAGDPGAVPRHRPVAEGRRPARAVAGAVRDRRGRSGQPVAGAAARGAQGPARAAAGGRAGLRYADRRLPGRPPGERTGDPSGRRRFLFPHRRHHRHAEAGAAQPLQRGGDGRDHGPERRLRGGRRAALRPAAVPRQRRDGYRPGALPSRRPGAPGRAPGLPQSDPDPGLLEAGGTLPGHQLQWRADHLRGVAAGPQRWPRPVQPAFRPVRRGADAGGADPPVRGAYRAQGDRGLRPHRRYLAAPVATRVAASAGRVRSACACRTAR